MDNQRRCYDAHDVRLQAKLCKILTLKFIQLSKHAVSEDQIKCQDHFLFKIFFFKLVSSVDESADNYKYQSVTKKLKL